MSSTQTGPTLIRIVVRSIDNALLGEARVYCEQSPVPMPDVAALTNEDGEVLLAAPGPGSYCFGVSLEPFLTETISITVTDEAEIALTAVLQPKSVND